MANTVVTVRPTSTPLNSRSLWTAQASGTLHGVTSDNTDTTWAQLAAFPGSGGTDLVFAIAAASIPALAQIRSLTPRARMKTDTYLGYQFGFSFAGSNLVWEVQSSPQDGVIRTLTGAARTTRADGTPWDTAGIAGLQFHTNYGTGGLLDQNVNLYEAYIDVAYNQVPVVSAVTPTGTITTTAQPTVGWTYTDPEGDAQERYQVKIYAGTGTIADPDNTAAYWSSGEVFSAVASALVAVVLPAGAYRVYVKAADVGSNGRYSAWATQTFTIQVDAPGTPAVSAVADGLLARIAVNVQGIDNLLTANQASLETDTTGWAAGTNTTISRSTAQFINGAASLALTSVAAGDTAAINSATGDRPAVIPGRLYTAVASFRAATTGRSVRLDIRWYTAAGGTISDTAGLTAVDATTGWTQAFASGIAPLTAASASVIPRALATGAASEVHYVDQISLGPTPVRNLLTPAQSGFEVDLSTWVVNANATIARTTTVADEGAASLALTPITNGTNMSANATGPGSAAVPVVAGQVYAATARVRSSGTVRTDLINLLWYTGAGAFISTTGGGGVTEVAGAWVTAIVTATAPATAAYVVVQPLITTPSEVHYVDRVQLFVSSVNVLTPNTASFETDATGWAPVTNAPTIARTTAAGTFLDGAAGISLTATAAGPAAMAAMSQPVTLAVAGQSYTAIGHSKAAATPRLVALQINWFGAGGAYISTTTGSLTTNSTTAWTQHVVTGTAPAAATTTQVILYVPSNPVAGEAHYFDSIASGLAGDFAWLAGSRAVGSVIIVEKSIDGGTTWTTVRAGTAALWNSAADQQINLYDYEVARNVSVLYRARIVATVGTLVASSPNGQSSAVAHAATGWWLKDPLAPGTNMQIDVQPGFAYRRKEPQSVLEPLGRATSVVITDGVKGIEGTIAVWAKDAARYAKVLAITGSGHNLWLEDVFGRAWYVHLGNASEWSLLRAAPLGTETTPIRHIHNVTMPFTEVGSPPGDLVAAGTPTL